MNTNHNQETLNRSKQEELYPHSCEMYEDCIDFLEGHKTYNTYKEFCNSVCKNCKDCLWLNIPHDDFEI